MKARRKITIAMNKFILTTMCYIRKEDSILLLHRIKKENDINEGKWIGVGGKLKKGESPEECIQREIIEETGIEIRNLQMHGFVVFPSLYYGEDEGMFVYTADYFHGNIKDCDEGILQWVKIEDFSKLKMWKGDYHFLEWIRDDDIHIAKVVYKDDELIDYQEKIY